MGEPPPAALLRGVFESVPDAVVVVDDAGLIVLANARCRATFGWEPEALVGEPVARLVPERFQGEESGFRGDPGAGSTGLLRVAAMHRSGREFPAEVALARIAADGRDYVAATIRDIRGRLREEERFRNLLEAAPDATVIIDRAATIVLANRRVQEMLGYEAGELVGRSLAVLAAAPGPEEVLARIDAYLQEPETVPMGYSQEFRVRHRDGHDLPVELALTPLETAEGVLVSISVRDVSVQRRLESDNQRQRDELIATVSHELRTPLASIIGYAELMSDLADHDLSPRGRELLAVIERNAARELRLVDDLLTMAYLDDNRLRIQRDEVDLAEVGRRVVEDMMLRARERELVLTLVADEVAPARGDFYRLVQVLENLLTNAIKFTRPGGKVQVTIADGGVEGVLEVADTGIGVSPEEQEHLFERLYRAPSAIRSQTQGAGLGLPIVRAIVEAHGGRVEVDSEVGVGTRVRVSIPYLGEEP